MRTSLEKLLKFGIASSGRAMWTILDSDTEDFSEIRLLYKHPVVLNFLHQS